MFKRGLTRAQRILWRITKPVLILWLILEFFRSLVPYIYSQLPEGFRSFMFDGWIEYWNTHIADALPEALDRIPVWNDPAVGGSLMIWGFLFFFLARGRRKENRVRPERGSGTASGGPCTSCGGAGTKPCMSCGGTGHGMGGETFCSSCGGRSSQTCSSCNGSGKER